MRAAHAARGLVASVTPRESQPEPEVQRGTGLLVQVESGKRHRALAEIGPVNMTRFDMSTSACALTTGSGWGTCSARPNSSDRRRRLPLSRRIHLHETLYPGPLSRDSPNIASLIKRRIVCKLGLGFPSTCFSTHMRSPTAPNHCRQYHTH